MGKKPSDPAAGPSKSVPKSDAALAGGPSIDDIFAKPQKASAIPCLAQLSRTIGHSKGKSKATSKDSIDPESIQPKKKKKKSKALTQFNPSAVAPESIDSAAPGPGIDGPSKPKRKEVETVMDPALVAIEAKIKAAKVAKSATKDQAEGGKKRSRKEDEEDLAFRDSRGDGPRRKTEEGFLIYKEAELKIDPEAGGTPLCPFDCECCF